MKGLIISFIIFTAALLVLLAWGGCAGAPAPSRPLTPAECWKNLKHKHKGQHRFHHQAYPIPVKL